jgi:hypothetical protein
MAQTPSSRESLQIMQKQPKKGKIKWNKSKLKKKRKKNPYKPILKTRNQSNTE